MVENANTSPTPDSGSPAAEVTEALDNESEGPCLSFALAEDLSRKDQLFSIRKPPPQPSKQKDYRPSEQQLLRAGKLGESQISARLKQVKFGTFKGETACLVVVQVDFAPKNGGWFRFRNATVELEFEEEGGEEDDEDGPLVLKHYPELIRGHIQTVAESFGITIASGIPPPLSGGGVSGDWRVSRSREAQHLVQALLVGDPERGVKWKLSENEARKSGIYQQPIFVAIVRYREERGFVMTLGMKATTYGGLPVRGKGGSKIKFSKGNKQQERGEQPMPGLVGGSIASGGTTWTSEKDSETSQQLLEDEDLEIVTGMKANLLAEEGPGGGRDT